MWHVNAYIIEKPAFRGFFPVRRTKSALRALAYTHQRIIWARGGRARYVHNAGLRTLTLRIRKAYAYMRGWRARNRGRRSVRVPRPYLRINLDLNCLGL